MSDQPDIEREMTYATYEDSCRDAAILDTPDGPDLRMCRRPRWHEHGNHASGFGQGFRRWGSWA